jgi:DNA-directed RNA polymerase specialized sigma24 family protein
MASAKLPNPSRVGASPLKLFSPSDRAILAGLEQQEPWAAEAFYDSTAPVVERALVRLLQRRSGDFDDLIHKTLDRLARAIAERRFWLDCSLAVWASVYAVGVGLEALRARDRELCGVDSTPRAAADEDDFPPSAVTELLETRGQTITMQRTLVAMKADLAEVIFLHDALGCSVADLSSVMGITAEVVTAQLSRGRHDLLRRLGTLKRTHSST